MTQCAYEILFNIFNDKWKYMQRQKIRYTINKGAERKWKLGKYQKFILDWRYLVRCRYRLRADTTLSVGQGSWPSPLTFLSSDVTKCPRAYLLSQLEVYQVCCGGGENGTILVSSDCISPTRQAWIQVWTGLERSFVLFWMQLISPATRCRQITHV